MRNETSPAGTVKSGAKLLRIVSLLKEYDGLRVSELADVMDTSKGSIHRYLKTLQKCGYATKSGSVYRLSLRFLDYGIYRQKQNELYQIARPKVEALATDVDERAWCHIEERGQGIFIHGAVGENVVATDARIGRHVPLHTTSGGKAILAELPDARVEEIIQQRGLPQRTDQTVSSPEQLFAELEDIRERGYALNFEESIDGLHAVGASVVNEDGVLGAISISGAAHRMPESQCNGQIADRVLAATNEVELDLIHGAD
jgi:DNA-binding IclR family transcriptional regulator